MTLKGQGHDPICQGPVSRKQLAMLLISNY